MRIILAAVLLSVAACGQVAEAPPEAPPTAEVAPPASEAPAADLGPYTNSWDAAEVTRFQHMLWAAEPGARTIRLQAQTDATGGETVAVYPLRADGSRAGGRIVFVVADRDGEQVEAVREVPAEGLSVSVVVENAGGRRHAGTYTLTVE
ncbi:MAG: hypothetical protein H7124_03565 [Phycisphaerales bacterium]|nr:hypothetical protein [Hyphomonadaceae bacterium]